MTKNNIFKLLAIAVSGMSITSCVDTLDVNRTDAISDVAIWSSLEVADAYITASYKIFTDDVQLKNDATKFWDSFSDISKSSSWSQYGHPYNTFLLQGLTSGENGAGAFECWTSEYSRIRTANVCLRDLREYGAKFDESARILREAEIRLCRAYSYFRLARVYGGVIIRTESSGQSGVPDGVFESDRNQPRATEAETYRFILDELQYAADNLPEQNSSTWLRGRATRKVALALKSRIALFAKQWDEAAKAAEECGECEGVDLDPDFANLFSPNCINSPEVLFCIEYFKGDASLYHLWDTHVSPAGDNAINLGGAYAAHQPTSELADLYEWNDGTPFNWNTWQSEGHADPFTDREKRFQVTILYNGADWRGRKIEAYDGGVDGFAEFEKTGSTGGKTCTGYFFRKFLEEDNMNFVEGGDKSTTPDLVVRYGEVLLNQAEAYANIDLAANQSKVLDCINRIRRRAELPAKTVSDIATFDQCMALIRNERAKELVCEGFRFWDLRRWGLAESVIGGQMVHGIKIKKSGSTYTYEHISCDAGTNRVYPSRYNYFSIPLSERSKNSACTNNPGW